jgi:hypothetical protein
VRFAVVAYTAVWAVGIKNAGLAWEPPSRLGRQDESSICSSASTRLSRSFFSPRRMFFETAVVETSNSSASVGSVASRGVSK